MATIQELTRASQRRIINACERDLERMDGPGKNRLASSILCIPGPPSGCWQRGNLHPDCYIRHNLREARDAMYEWLMLWVADTAHAVSSWARWQAMKRPPHLWTGDRR